MNTTRYLAAQITRMIGIALIGAMTGTAISLHIVQTAAINQGIIIIGAPIPDTHQLYQSLKTLQTLANTTGFFGMILLTVYGIHEYRTMETKQ